MDARILQVEQTSSSRREDHLRRGVTRVGRKLSHAVQAPAASSGRPLFVAAGVAVLLMFAAVAPQRTGTHGAPWWPRQRRAPAVFALLAGLPWTPHGEHGLAAAA